MIGIACVLDGSRRGLSIKSYLDRVYTKFRQLSKSKQLNLDKCLDNVSSGTYIVLQFVEIKLRPMAHFNLILLVLIINKEILSNQFNIVHAFLLGNHYVGIKAFK